MRFVLITALAGLMLAAPACGGADTAPSQARTLAAFQPHLTMRLTPALARTQFGAPDEETGSGLRIYIYRLDDGRRLWLGFPGDAPIVYARIEAVDGAVSDLTLQP